MPYTRRLFLVGLLGSACRRMSRTNQVVWTGDSITLGPPHVAEAQRYANLVADAVPPIASGAEMIAAGSATLGSGQGAEADGLYDAGLQINICSVFFGANDMQTESGATFFANLKTFCLARRAVGFKVIVLTALPNTTNGGIEIPRRNVANALIRGDDSFYDALADIAADPDIGPDAACEDTDYYSDGVHLTALGHQIVEGYVTPAVYNLITSVAAKSL